MQINKKNTAAILTSSEFISSVEEMTDHNAKSFLLDLLRIGYDVSELAAGCTNKHQLTDAVRQYISAKTYEIVSEYAETADDEAIIQKQMQRIANSTIRFYKKVIMKGERQHATD